MTQLLQLSAGLPYCFSIYSEALKDRFNWNQTQLQTVAFACSLGAYLGVISGLFYDYFREYDKLGPRCVDPPPIPSSGPSP